MSDRDLKKLIKALEIVIQTGTGKIPKVEMNIRHNTTPCKIEEDPKVCSNCIYAYDGILAACPNCGSNLTE